jgi:hypothetical protein
MSFVWPAFCRSPASRLAALRCNGSARKAHRFGQWIFGHEKK